MKGIKAFTLVEILIVVAIMAILLAIAVPNFIHARDMSQAQDCIANLHQIDSAKSLLQEDLRLPSSYAPTQAQLVGTVGGNPGYLKSFPVCPSGGTYTINQISEFPTCTITAPIAHTILPPPAG